MTKCARITLTLLALTLTAVLTACGESTEETGEMTDTSMETSAPVEAEPEDESFTVGWTNVPMRTREQGEKGIAGGEGSQWCLYNMYCPQDGSIAFFGTDVGGLYKSDDGGKSWRMATVGLNSRGATGIAFDPNNKNRVICVGANSLDFPQGGLYLSDDCGETWRGCFNIAVSSYRDIRTQVAFDSTTFDAELDGSAVIYWSSEGQGLYKSENGGKRWTKLKDTEKLENAQLFCHPTEGWLYAAGKNGLYISKDGGESFTQLYDKNVVSIDVIPTKPDNIYIATSDATNEGFFVSEDCGATFAKVSESGFPTEYPAHLRVSPANPDNIMVQNDLAELKNDYSCTDFYSNDGGKTWQKSTLYEDTSAIKIMGRQHAFSWNPDNGDECITFGGDMLLRSEDGGKSFHWSNSGYSGSYLTYLTINVNNPDIIAVSNQDYNGAYSVDGGKIWKYIPWLNEYSGQTYGAYALDENTVFMAFRDNGNRFGLGSGKYVLLYTDDGGKTIKNTGCTVTKGNWGSMGAVGNDDVVMLGEWRTADRGKTWQQMQNCSQVIAYDPESGDLYGTMNESLVKSTDGGETWTTLHTFPRKLRDLAYDVQGGYVYLVSADTVTVYKYDQTSDTATTLNVPVPDGIQNIDLRSVAVDPTNSDIIYLGNCKNVYQSPVGVLRSNDGGKTWTNLCRNKNDGSFGADGGKEAEHVRISPNGDIFVTTGCHGLWKLSSAVLAELFD